MSYLVNNKQIKILIDKLDIDKLAFFEGWATALDKSSDVHQHLWQDLVEKGYVMVDDGQYIIDKGLSELLLAWSEAKFSISRMGNKDYFCGMIISDRAFVRVERDCHNYILEKSKTSQKNLDIGASYIADIDYTEEKLDGFVLPLSIKDMSSLVLGLEKNNVDSVKEYALQNGIDPDTFLDAMIDLTKGDRQRNVTVTRFEDNYTSLNKLSTKSMLKMVEKDSEIFCYLVYGGNLRIRESLYVI